MNEAGGANPVPSEMKAFEPTELLFTELMHVVVAILSLSCRMGEKMRLGAE